MKNKGLLGIEKNTIKFGKMKMLHKYRLTDIFGQQPYASLLKDSVLSKYQDVLKIYVLRECKKKTFQIFVWNVLEFLFQGSIKVFFVKWSKFSIFEKFFHEASQIFCFKRI